jgi:hypothetical protein
MGKSLSASMRKNSCPTAPLAPTIATFIFVLLIYDYLFCGAKLQLFPLLSCQDDKKHHEKLV